MIRIWLDQPQTIQIVRKRSVCRRVTPGYRFILPAPRRPLSFCYQSTGWNLFYQPDLDAIRVHRTDLWLGDHRAGRINVNPQAKERRVCSASEWRAAGGVNCSAGRSVLIKLNRNAVFCKKSNERVFLRPNLQLRMRVT